MPSLQDQANSHSALEVQVSNAKQSDRTSPSFRGTDDTLFLQSYVLQFLAYHKFAYHKFFFGFSQLSFIMYVMYTRFPS